QYKCMASSRASFALQAAALDVWLAASSNSSGPSSAVRNCTMSLDRSSLGSGRGASTAVAAAPELGPQRGPPPPLLQPLLPTGGGTCSRESDTRYNWSLLWKSAMA